MLPVGCLLIGETASWMQRMQDELTRRGVYVLCSPWADVQKGFYAVQNKAVRACVAAEGGMWIAALALAVQLNVDRVVLMGPSGGSGRLQSDRQRQANRMKAYVRRNLFFCVSDLLVIDGDESVMWNTFGRAVNARMWFYPEGMGKESFRTAAEFLCCDDYARWESACN